jgi:epsilon-lactone hydrolase
MSVSLEVNLTKSQTSHVRISGDEHEREVVLRERFGRFWSQANGDAREKYDSFISLSPLAPDVSLECVELNDVRGWWVYPERTQVTSKQAILYLHGGGYVMGSGNGYRGFVSQLVTRARIPAFIVDYPLAPEATLPAAPRAAIKAWAWLVNQGFDRIVIAGDSAGGNLTLVTLAELSKRAHGPAPKAGVVFSPWTDLALTGASMRDPAIQDPLIGFEFVRECARKVLGKFDPRDPLASPLYGDLRGLPPLLIQVGSDELLLDDSRRYAELAAKAGVPVTLQIWEGMHHVFQQDVLHIYSARQALLDTAKFISAAMRHDIQAPHSAQHSLASSID